MVEKVPEFSAESLCLRQGMATSGRWCHMKRRGCHGDWRAKVSYNTYDVCETGHIILDTTTGIRVLFLLFCFAHLYQPVPLFSNILTHYTQYMGFIGIFFFFFFHCVVIHDSYHL